MSARTEKADAGRTMSGNETHTPKVGEHFRCQQCGMEVEVTTGCKCSDPDHVSFECCGKKMQRA